MTGETHIAIGIASSLVILQPKTIPECLCAITGGLIGGMISDIDSPGKRKSMDYSEDPYGWQVYSFIGIALVFLLCLDYLAGDGVVSYVKHNHGPQLFAGLIAFCGLCFYGVHTNHRSFTHSVLAGCLFGISIWCFCKPLVLPFLIGFVSHLFLDFFNKKKVQYLWPLPWKFGLNKYPSDGRLNSALGGIGVTASIFLSTFFFIRCFANSLLFKRLTSFFTKSITLLGKITIPFFIPYLIVINIISLFIYLLDYNLFIRGLVFYRGNKEDANSMSEFILTLLLIIDVMGGMIGKLIAVNISLKGKFYKAKAIANFNFYIIPLCILFSWIAMLYTFFKSTIMRIIEPVIQININNVLVLYVVLGYFILINIITMILFPRMKRFGYVITKREKTCMVLGMLGGASGGYLSMKVTGNHENATMLVATLPEMMAMHAIILTCFFIG